MPPKLPQLAACVALLAAVPCAAAPVRVTLKNGDILNGELARQSDEVVVIRHAVLGELSVARADVRALVVGEGAIAKQDTRVHEQKVAREPDNGLLGSGWLKDWERRLEAGVSGAAGASDNQQAHVGFMADYEDTEVRWAQRARFFRAESDGDETANSATVSLALDDLLPGTPRFRFAGGQYDQDKFQDWRNRLAVNGGLGYQFASTPRYRLLGRAGVGATYVWGGADGEAVAPELLIGFDSRWKLSRRQNISFTNALYPGLKAGSGYRLVTGFDWIIDLDKEVGLGLKIGINNEHDSKPDDGGERNDFKYTSSLMWRL
jgi:putative salt-induced outer membrane protein YdiY